MTIERVKREITMPGKRKHRSDKGNVLVTERDRRVLLWLAEQYAGRLDQIQYLLGQEAGRGAKVAGQISESAARLVVARWERAGLAAHKKVFVREPSWAWLTARALHEFGLPYKSYTPSLVSLNHLYAVNQVRMTVEKEHPDDIWISERKIRADMVYQKGARLPHVPDGILQLKKGKIAIEVELTLKKPAVLQVILRELLAAYQWVWYVVTEETRDAVSAAQKKLDSSSADRIGIYPIWW